ncbi:hypothetical protein A2415_00290 [candidate division WWE3 bacterium RIFOXYC1_FULL_39_7]|uniref:SH3b domain-containing protein n=1 Tax=candidate division WWE3 bacterium RIFOXYC1_FULL_39_7 TaxID=1802643 RepID=A0A1F4WMK1_UNCKA|nr:MAG: hypothetical protein A2415_00290 [candidate division WWE3 bacterium RIFOXYC1_FULL_39_7]
MGKLRTILIVLLVLFTLAGVGTMVFNFLVPKSGGLLIETSPASTIYINGEEVGRTPYTSLRKAGEITLRLIPDSFGQPLSPFEEKINLVSGVETVVRRYFGDSREKTEGEILSFEKLPTKSETGIIVVTEPEGAQVVIDTVSKGTSPYSASSLESGVHTLKLSVNGYKDRSVELNLIKGFKLVAYVKLAKLEIQENKIEEVKPVTQKLVKILSTPTGFLRVRSEASSSAKEVGQVKPGGEFGYLGESEDGDWYKINFDEELEGWVTGQYSEVIEKTATESASIVD